MSELPDHITWTPLIEAYFKDTGERSQCLSILHSHAENIYSHRKTFIDLPVAIGSAITGFISVGSSSMFSNQQFASIMLGVASLFVSILNTTGSYFQWSKRAEGHRISAIQYARNFRFLTIELSLPREERMTAHDLLKKVRDDYERLAEISPPLPAESISYFNSKFKAYKTAKPDECNGLIEITVFKAEVEKSQSPLVQTEPGRPHAELHVRVPALVDPPPST
jgi:hypothetical protein